MHSRALTYALAATGLLGAIATVALPFVEIGGHSVKAIDVRAHGAILLAAFLVPVALAGVAAWRGAGRWLGALSALSLAIAGMKSTGDGGASGQTLALFSAFLGLLIALTLVVRPPRRQPDPGRLAPYTG